MLKFTTARYDLANGRTIDKRLSEDKGLWGVDPSEGLVVLESIEELRERIKSREPYTVITDDEPDSFECGNIQWIEDILHDHQLAQALFAMQTQIEQGTWPILSQENPVVSGIREEVTELAKERIDILKLLIDVDQRLANLQTELDDVNESLIPVDADLENAVMTITDHEGNVVGSWRVKNGNIEAALDSLQLEPESTISE
jgi:hypothetical protein